MPSAEPVFALSDLERWTHRGASLAVLGHPIGHSLSPQMHNAALAEISRTDGRFADWKYFRFDVPPDQLPQALERLHERGFRGVNLTLPHKVLAFGHIAAVDDAARPVGAVNTLLREARGWRGFNTDGYGLATAVREELGRELRGTPIVVLGAGGAARGAAVECLLAGCASLWIANRTASNLEALVEAIAPVAPGVPREGLDLDRPPFRLPPGALVINATSAGLRESDPPPADLSKLPRPGAFYDMIYSPPRTPILRQAAELGIPAANGLGMLVHQGAKALEIWTGIAAGRTAPAMRLAAARALDES